MTSPVTLEQQLQQTHAFELPQDLQLWSVCPQAQAFAAWCEALVKPVRAQPDEIPVNVALLHLQDQFFARYESTKGHKHERSDQPIPCLFDIYRRFFVELRELRWQVNPPLLRAPPPPPAPPQVLGVPWMARK